MIEVGFLAGRGATDLLEAALGAAGALETMALPMEFCLEAGTAAAAAAAATGSGERSSKSHPSWFSTAKESAWAVAEGMPAAATTSSKRFMVKTAASPVMMRQELATPAISSFKFSLPMGRPTMEDEGNERIDGDEGVVSTDPSPTVWAEASSKKWRSKLMPRSAPAFKLQQTGTSR